jgi:hypothetical protein
VDGKAATSTYASSGGAAFRKLGKKNFHILEVLLDFTNLSSDVIDTALAKSGIPKLLFRLIQAFPWHSLMHNIAHKLFSKIFNQYPLSFASLLEDDCGVFSTLEEISKNGIRHKKSNVSPQSWNYGYLGQLKKISREIENLIEQGKIDLSESKLRDLFFSLPRRSILERLVR